MNFHLYVFHDYLVFYLQIVPVKCSWEQCLQILVTKAPINFSRTQSDVVFTGRYRNFHRPGCQVSSPSSSSVSCNIYVYIYMCVCVCVCVYSVSQEERSIFWEVIVSVILSKKLYMNMCPIPNGFRERAIWLYSGLAWAPSIVLPSRPADSWYGTA
jgi:hypothetical protein